MPYATICLKAFKITWVNDTLGGTSPNYRLVGEDVAAAISFPVQRLQPLEPIFAFAYYDRLSPLSPEKINPNLASVEEIASIPGLNPDLSQKIRTYTNVTHR